MRDGINVKDCIAEPVVLNSANRLAQCNKCKQYIRPVMTDSSLHAPLVPIPKEHDADCKLPSSWSALGPTRYMVHISC